jgi:multiple sugar transport system permease protein
MIKFISNRRIKAEIKRVALSIIMMMLSVTMLLPIIWMLSASFKFENQVFTFPIRWIPEQWNFDTFLYSPNVPARY